MRRLLPLLFVACAQPVADREPPSLDTDAGAADPGQVFARRRLSALEIERSAASALGVVVPTSPWLPPDPVIAGFTHLADGLPVSAEFIDSLEMWARAVATAVVAPTSPAGAVASWTWQAEELPWSSGLRGVVGLHTFTVFWIVGEHATATFEVPSDGRWQVQGLLVGSEAAAGPFTATVRVDDEVVGELSFDAGWVGLSAAELSAGLWLGAGPHTVSLEPDFVRDRALPEPVPGLYYMDDQPFVGLDALTLTGEEVPALAPTTSSLLACDGEVTGAPACTTAVVRRLLERLWRRPVSDDEISRLVGVVDVAQQDGLSWSDAVGEALVGALLSPSFLFHLESSADAVAADGRSLWPYVMANRLSYALWQTAPDDRLLDCARAGGLAAADDGPCGLLPVARRMLQDPAADVLVDEFALRWFGVHDVDRLWLLNRDFPRYTEGLLHDEQRETAALFRELWRSGADLRDLLTAEHSWMTWRVADLYGLDAQSLTDLDRVLLAGSGRVGLLGHGSVLTATANGTDPTSVDRATWVLGNLLCRTLPRPPADVPPLPNGDAPITDRFEAHVSDPACASCHAAIDPFGLPLSRFDALGELRTDGSGQGAVTMPDGTVVTSVEAYARWLHDEDDLATCTVRRVLSWVSARDVTRGDDARIRDLTDRALAAGFSFEAILEIVITEASFSQPEATP